MADEVTGQETVAEESAITCGLSDMSEYELPPSGDDELSRYAVCETLTETVEERYEEPEPESWDVTLAPPAADMEIAADETPPHIALDGELEVCGERLLPPASRDSLCWIKNHGHFLPFARFRLTVILHFRGLFFLVSPLLYTSRIFIGGVTLRSRAICPHIPAGNMLVCFYCGR